MTSREFADRVTRRARKAAVRLPDGVVERLEGYYRLLEAWNAKINLTALDLANGPDSTIDRLLIEPLVAARHLPEGSAVIDIGSGGGSPAIPLQLMRPDLRMTLVEAKVRKCAFLREAGRHLELTITVENSRYESLLARPDLHEAFDVGTMRAVRLESRVLLGLQAFLRPGGQFLLFRGPVGADMPSVVSPPLFWHATHMLLESDRSRLVVLRKAFVGAYASSPGSALPEA
jgi:16S rRNA (guanine527-N7)-methyltransferase